VTGSPTSRLLVLRGNSGSGKSTTAQTLRDRLGRGTAWIEQDQIRRILLWEKD
jgi:predicted kinase